jgi:branched-chain amino acid transport system substrate-binding protein
MMIWTRSCLAALAAATFACNAPAQQEVASRPIRVGYICPASGGSQDFGRASRLGLELAVKEINEVGGYMGRPLEIVARDDKANPDEGRRAAEELVTKEQVAFTIAGCNSGVALKMLDVFQSRKHLLIVPVATATSISAVYPPAGSYVFRMSARDTLQAGVLADDMARRGFKRVAIFADRTGYGEAGLKDMQRLLADRGIAVAHVARFDLGVKSLADEVRTAKANGAAALVGFTVGPEQAVLARSRVEAGFAGPQYGPWTLSFRSVAEQAGAAAEGAIMTQTIVQDLSNERRSSFIARLRRTAGDQPIGSLMSAAQTYDAMHLVLRAMFQTRGRTDGDALKAALENLERPYGGVVTSYERPFSSADHDAVSGNMIWLGVWRGGEVQFLYAEDAKRASYIRRKEL